MILSLRDATSGTSEADVMSDGRHVGLTLKGLR